MYRTYLFIVYIWIALFFITAGTLHADILTWNFDSSSDVVNAYNLQNVSYSDGSLSAQTAWDPFIYLRLPAGGISAEKLTRLTIRAYSSAASDNMDVYYQNASGDWSLAPIGPLVKGWYTYTIFLNDIDWAFQESSGPDGQKWGGRDGNVVQFRFDPGNHSGRQIMIDQVVLSDGREYLREANRLPLDDIGTYALSLTYLRLSAKATGTVYANISYTDIFGQPTGSPSSLRLRLTGRQTNWATFTGSLTPPRLAAWAHLRFVLSGKTLRNQIAVKDLNLTLTNKIFPASTEQPSPSSTKRVVLSSSGLPDARIDYSSGSPVILVNGTPLCVVNEAKYAPPAYDTLLNINCRDNGVRLHMLHVLGTPPLTGGSFDFSSIDTQVLNILNVDPNAYIILNIGVDFVNAPALKSWMQGDVRDLCTDSNGSTDISGYGGGWLTKCPSLASDGFQSKAETLVRALVRHVAASPYAGSVVGFFPASGVSWEWQQWGSTEAPYTTTYVDYSESARQAFITWLQAKYTTLSALNTAWGTSLASWNSISIPSQASRISSNYYSFINPATGRKEIDFRRYYAESVAGAIVRLCKAIKEESASRSLTGIYYGYICHILYAYRYHLAGHEALLKYMDSPYVDIGISPSMYSGREMGQGSGFMSATESFKLRDKLWIDQCDHRTHHQSQELARTTNLSDDAAVIERHVAADLARGAATQVYDFSNASITGDPRLMQIMGKAVEIDGKLRAVGRRKFAPEASMAVIVDDVSTDYTALSSYIHHDLIERELLELPKSGIGYNVFHLSDLERIPSDFKCYMFLNTFRLTAAQKDWIDTNLKGNGNTLVFLVAPGILNDNALDTSRVQSVLGIPVDCVSASKNLVITVNSTTIDGVTFSPNAYANTLEFGPYFTPRGGTVIGTLADGNPGLVEADFSTWKLFFSTVPSLPASTVRSISQVAGVRVTNSYEGDVTYVGDKLVAVHTIDGGTRTLDVGTSATILEDLFTGRNYSVVNGKVTVNLDRRSTNIFMIH